MHINKTGGSSVGNAIGLAVKNHLTTKEIIKRVGQQPWDEAYKTIGHEQDQLFYDNRKSFQPQADWLKDSQGHISMDTIGRVKRINEDIERFEYRFESE